MGTRCNIIVFWLVLNILAMLIAGCYLPSLPGLGSLYPEIQKEPVYDIENPNPIVVQFPRQGQDPSKLLCKLYNGAKKTIDVAIYSLTHKDILRALVDAKKRGVQVRIVTDETQAGGASQKVAISALLAAGIPIKKDNHSGLMHLKMSIIDNIIVTSGSYNYSMSASEDNDEMFVVFQDPYPVSQCIQEFERIWTSNKYEEAK